MNGCCEGHGPLWTFRTQFIRGYRVVACHEVWHYNDASDDLFESYMNRFLKVKVHAGGFPAWCDTDEKKAQFVADYKQVLKGVELDVDKMKKNPSMYTVSKLYLNTLWGKFGQRQNLGSMKMINTEEEFWRLLLTDGVELPVSSFMVNGTPKSRTRTTMSCVRLVSTPTW